MDRKIFLGTILPLAAGLQSIGSIHPGIVDEPISVAIPPFLQNGDSIGICSPAGSITSKDIQPAVDKLGSWGFKVRIGNSIGKKDFTFGGTDAERFQDLQEMLDDPEMKAILCARGGYGIIRILDRLNFTSFRAHPKWIIGFSDATVLHCHINHNLRIATIHSKMCNSFPADWEKAEEPQKNSINSIRNLLVGKPEPINIPSAPSNKMGRATGELVGGNLRIIENLMGTQSELHTEGKILFLEDTEEYLYNIDRMFWNLKRTGKLKHLKGLIIGGFKAKPDDPGEEFGLNVEQIVLEKIKEYDYPVCFNFPVGHQKNNIALGYGMRYVLNVDEQKATLTLS